MIDFYATIARDSVRPYMPTNIRILLPASSFFDNGKLYQPKLPKAVFPDRAADCGGFVASRIWGDYRYTADQYVDWLRGWSPSWAATMDYCCEDELTSGRPGIVRARQKRTTDLAWYFWNVHRNEDWIWVPTIQGWHTDEYRRHAREMNPLIQHMHRCYGPKFRVGIGTLCRRASVQQIHEVVGAVCSELPGIGVHLWGVKQGAIQSKIGLPRSVVSVDSAAWNGLYGRNIEKWRESGMREAEYAYRVNLPAYIARFEAACREPKQMPLLMA
jgi:hypothetical protein